MKVNLGSRDAARWELDFQKCVEGAEITVNEDAAAEMVRVGFAFVSPSSIKGVPEEPTISEVKSPSIVGDEKSESTTETKSKKK